MVFHPDKRQQLHVLCLIVAVVCVCWIAVYNGIPGITAPLPSMESKFLNVVKQQTVDVTSATSTTGNNSLKTLAIKSSSRFDKSSGTPFNDLSKNISNDKSDGIFVVDQENITTGKTYTENIKHNPNNSSGQVAIVTTEVNQTASPTDEDNDTPNKTYLCVVFNGGLGNHMFEMAALLGTARSHGSTPVFPKDSRLRQIFNIDVPELDENVCKTFHVINNIRHCAFDPIEADFSLNCSMSGFFQSWKFFSNVFPDLRRQLTFKKDVLEQAADVLKKSVQLQHGNLLVSDITFVGLHIRRGDILYPEKVKYGYNVGSKNYVFKAMDYFINLYENVMFVVCSNDMKWTRDTIANENATFILDQKAEIDMAVLSLCNHSIFTVGTFGWWSSWLAGGRTVYQIEQVIPGTDLDRHFNLYDFMLPDWIGISQN